MHDNQGSPINAKGSSPQLSGILKKPQLPLPQNSIDPMPSPPPPLLANRGPRYNDQDEEDEKTQSQVDIAWSRKHHQQQQLVLPSSKLMSHQINNRDFDYSMQQPIPETQVDDDVRPSV